MRTKLTRRVVRWRLKAGAEIKANGGMRHNEQESQEKSKLLPWQVPGQGGYEQEIMRTKGGGPTPPAFDRNTCSRWWQKTVINYYLCLGGSKYVYACLRYIQVAPKRPFHALPTVSPKADSPKLLETLGHHSLGRSSQLVCHAANISSRPNLSCRHMLLK